MKVLSEIFAGTLSEADRLETIGQELLDFAEENSKNERIDKALESFFEDIDTINSGTNLSDDNQ